MPPKAKKQEPSKKTDQKKKEKIIEDKTFGLKNKKGAKQQRFIKNVTNQVKVGNVSARKAESLNPDKDKAKKKDDKKAQQEELNMLFRPVEQKVTKGADPKSILCAFFKQGQCQKGAKCKFSHDLTLARKGEKKSIYSDEKDEDTMDTWDEAKLEEVVNKKHGESNIKKPKTDIICKYFLEAVENSKYGWFWDCPNGNDKCIYKHCLPPGFVLKKDKKKEEKENEITIEELIEKERAALGTGTTKVTFETFLKWKEKKKKEKVEKARKEEAKKKSDFKQGKMLGISGRLMFTFNPDLVGDEDDDEEVFTFSRPEEEEDASTVKIIDLDSFANQVYQENGTDATTQSNAQTPGENRSTEQVNHVEDESNKMDMAGAPEPVVEKAPDQNAAISAALAAVKDSDILAGDVPIDENLFDGEDLDLLEEDLETLELDD